MLVKIMKILIKIDCSHVLHKCNVLNFSRRIGSLYLEVNMDSKLLKFYDNRLRQIFFYITYDCNFSCKHCLIGDRANLAFYNKEEVFSILLTIKSNGGNKVTFLGGEPTLHPDFLKF